MSAPDASRCSRIYLDHAATTPLRVEVRAAMEPFLLRRFGNASSLHGEGCSAREGLEAARAAIVRALRADSFRFAFTGGGTEADNAAILGALTARLEIDGGAPARLHAAASAVEHPAVLGALGVAGAWGAQHTLVAVDDQARVDPDAVLAAVRPNTVLVSVMAINNEVGTVEPVREIGLRLRSRGIPLHVDAVQMLGKLPLDLDSLAADLVTISAHKIEGPKGVGGIFIRRELPFAGWIRGGPQEDGLRGGTEDVAGAVGFARAVELAAAEVEAESRRLEDLRGRLRRGIEKDLDGVRVNTPEAGAAPHILSASFERAQGESLLRLLDQAGVAVSTGSACTAGARKPSHVLRAMGRTEEEVRSSIRFSLGRTTSGADIDAALERLVRAVGQLRSIAPPRRSQKP